MSLNSFVLNSENITKNLQIKREIAVDCLDYLQERFTALDLKVDKRDLIPMAVAAYARFKEGGKATLYETGLHEGAKKDVRDIATIPELPEDTLALLYSIAIADLGAEAAVDDGSKTQTLWSSAIESGLLILKDLFDSRYSGRPSEFFAALQDLSEECNKQDA